MRVQFEIGLVERHLRGVDRAGRREPVLLQFPPRLGAQGFVLPQRRVAGTEAQVGPGDEHAIDVALQAPVQRREAELLPRVVTRAQIEARRAQPSDHAVLDHVAALEDAQQAAVGLATRIDRSVGDLVLQRALAGGPEARGAEVGAARLRRARLLQPGIDQRRELTRQALGGVEVHHRRASLGAAVRAVCA
ncbi:hypothetical protein GCM10009079_31510 [Ralstonia mannitolilytica]